jgi:hypothetical protein
MGAPAEKLEPDFFVARTFGGTKCWLRRTPENHFAWTPVKRRALPFASQALAAAAAADINEHASTAAVVERE